MFEQGSVEEKRFFLRAFLKSIVLAPERAEGEARFVLLSGLDKLWQPSNLIGSIEAEPAKSAEHPPLPAQKNSEGQEMSSELLVAGGRCVRVKRTLSGIAAYRENRINGSPYFRQDWKLKQIIGLGWLAGKFDDLD